MVTLVLLQGVVNTFVIFLSRIVGHTVDRAVFRTEHGYGPGYYVTSIVCADSPRYTRNDDRDVVFPAAGISSRCRRCEARRTKRHDQRAGASGRRGPRAGRRCRSNCRQWASPVRSARVFARIFHVPPPNFKAHRGVAARRVGALRHGSGQRFDGGVGMALDGVVVYGTAYGSKCPAAAGGSSAGGAQLVIRVCSQFQW